MSAFVCMNNRTYACIIELAMKYETITNPDLLAQRLYLLNVESVNQRYALKNSDRDSDRKEYRRYMEYLAEIRYEPQPQLHACQRIKAACCWRYKSCEGNCEEDTLFKAVEKVITLATLDAASEIKGEKVVDDEEAYRIVEEYAKKNSIDLQAMWE